jgi:hypothetical protein
MKFTLLFSYYLAWHYTRGFLDLFGVIQNFFWFLYNFFSIPTLLLTLFSPLMRLKETYQGDLDPGEYISTIAVNIIMRFVGAALRLFVIAMGIAFLLAALVGSAAAVALWVFLPPLVPVLFFGGIGMMFM